MADGLSVSGECFARGALGYEDARLASVWTKLKPDRHPALIVRARDAADVIEVVRFANRSGRRIAVKGSGHNFLGTYLQDDTILLDVSRLDGISLDGSVAEVGPGVKSRDLAVFLAAHGRAFPTGHNANVGLGGYLLGGGMGWNGENWGQMACHNIVSLDVVSASGDLVTADQTNHPDLFWAARGAGPYFPGIVVGFRLATYPYPAGMQGSVYVFPHAAAASIATWLSPVARAGFPDLELFLVLEATENRETGEIRRRDYCRAYVTSFAADEAQGRDVLRRVASRAPGGALEKAEFQPVSFDALYAESITGPVRRIANDTIWTDDGIAATRVLADHVLTAPSAGTVSVINFRGLPKGSEGSAARAWSADFLTWGAQWDRAEDDDENLEWLERSVALLEPFRTGCYVNETDFVRRPERLSSCYTPEAVRRIHQVRRDYDRGRVFSPLVELPGAAG